MFHVEHYLMDFSKQTSLPLSGDSIDKLASYVHFVCEANKKFNLTGFKSLELITHKLIIESLFPIRTLNVPRGTKFIDMGTGAGIPGIPLCLMFEGLSGVFVDSNIKKTEFLRDVIQKLGISNASVACGRGEDLARDGSFRGSFFFAVSRAFANVFAFSEICAPFIRVGGFLFLYSNEKLPAISQCPGLFSHLSALGIREATPDEKKSFGLPENNIALLKVKETPSAFPRRYAVIKREATKVLKDFHLQS